MPSLRAMPERWPACSRNGLSRFDTDIDVCTMYVHTLYMYIMCIHSKKDDCVHVHACTCSIYNTCVWLIKNQCMTQSEQ